MLLPLPVSTVHCSLQSAVGRAPSGLMCLRVGSIFVHYSSDLDSRFFSQKWKDRGLVLWYRSRGDKD